MTGPALALQLREWLREYERRRGQDVSRRWLASRLSVSVRSVYAYLSGTTLIPGDVLGRLLCLLEVPADRARALRLARDRVEDTRRRRGGLAVQELPPAAGGFTGRAGPLGELDRLAACPGRAGAARVCVLTGMAGVGKTALALAWAHGARGRFPDGCLFTDLRGFDPGEPVGPAQALGVLLHSLGLADAELPARLSGRISRYRTLAAGRRMLIVLDNAFCADQVRPLLPAEPGCFVLVTCREDLAGLVARDGAHRITLSPLAPEEGLAVLQAQLGRGRVQAERQAARALAGACGGLPLALRLAAEVASSRADEPLAVIAAELRERRLGVLAAAGDERADLRAVLSWSYCRMAAAHPGAAGAFRLLGTHPGPDFDAGSAAALLGAAPGQAATLIDMLARAHLAERRPGRRFGLHDVLRAYAAELSAARDSGQARKAALARLASYYAAAAEDAARCLASPGQPPPAADNQDGPRPAGLPGFADAGTARAWLDTERPGLVAVSIAAAEGGLCDYASRLSAALHLYLDTVACYHDAVTVHTCAMTAPGTAAKAAAQARLALACFRLGRLDDASAHARQALTAARQAGDHQTQLSAWQQLGAACARLGRNQAALGHFRAALTLARRTGDRLAEGRVIGALAIVHAEQQHYPQALEHGRRALALARELGDRSAQAVTAANLAAACMHLHRYAEARDCYQQAITKAQQAGNHDLLARARAGLREAARRLPPAQDTQTADLCRPVQDPLA